jgi:hypothetical protein
VLGCEPEKQTNNCCVVAKRTSKPDFWHKNMNDVNKFGGEGVVKANDK